MESESQSSVENNDVKTKRERIKQRLKDMGVSDDSVRPEKSFLSKYGKYFMVVVFGALLVAYGLEYSKQDETVDVQVAEDNTDSKPVSNPAQQTYPGYAYSQYNRMTALNYRPAPPPWMRPPAVQQENTGEENARGNSQNSPQNNPGNNGLNNNNMQQNNYPYYARRYSAYPRPYWHNYSGYYPATPQPMPGQMSGYGYRQAPGSYPTPYGRPPYYNGWQR